MTDFHGYPVRRLSSNSLVVDCLSTAGPRIVGLRYRGSENLLADVAEGFMSTAYGEYRYLGGHRLWHAPESMPRSYIPDGDGLTVSDVPNGLILEGRVEPGSGIRKRMEIRLDADQPKITLAHTLTNEGLWEVELAPWAITMFRLGGTAILPHRPDHTPAGSLLPNSHISFWPYTHMDDPRLRLEDEFILVRPKPGLFPFKVGTFNPKGWTAYWVDGVLYRKSYSVLVGLPHPDFDCNAEIYCDGNLIELESLAPLSRVGPGGSVTHTETWEFYDTLEQPFLSEKIIELIRSL